MIKKNVGHCEIDVIKVDKNIYYNKRQLDNGFGVVNNIEIYKFNNNKLKDTEYISIWDLNRYYTPTEYELDTIYFFFTMEKSIPRTCVGKKIRRLII